MWLHSETLQLEGGYVTWNLNIKQIQSGARAPACWVAILGRGGSEEEEEEAAAEVVVVIIILVVLVVVEAENTLLLNQRFPSATGLGKKMRDYQQLGGPSHRGRQSNNLQWRSKYYYIGWPLGLLYRVIKTLLYRVISRSLGTGDF